MSHRHPGLGQSEGLKWKILYFLTLPVITHDIEYGFEFSHLSTPQPKGQISLVNI
jgi:hypothetical protein